MLMSVVLSGSRRCYSRLPIRLHLASNLQLSTFEGPDTAYFERHLANRFEMVIEQGSHESVVIPDVGKGGGKYDGAADDLGPEGRVKRKLECETLQAINLEAEDLTLISKREDNRVRD